jgi:hypothetical protein
MHKHVNGFTLNPQTLRKQEEMENPPLGEFSILVLAATVAHHMDVVNPPKIWASAILNQPEWSVQAPEAAAATTTDIKDELGPSVSPQQAAKDFPRPAARAAIHTESSFLVKKPGGLPFSEFSQGKKIALWVMHIFLCVFLNVPHCM